MDTRTLVYTDEQMAVIEQDALRALREWLVENPVRNEDGAVMRWPDGTPVALSVLQVINVIRDSRH